MIALTILIFILGFGAGDIFGTFREWERNERKNDNV